MAAKHIVLTEKNGGMKDLMEKYYNMIYYCAYKINSSLKIRQA